MASFSMTTQKLNGNDSYYTPRDAFNDLSLYIPDVGKVWECFPGESESEQFMADAFPCEVVATDTDYFDTAPPEGTTLIVSNPPYSIKKRVFDRLRDIGLPFMMLVPIGTFSKQYVRWAQEEMQLIVPRKRIHFIVGGEQTRRTPFDVVWLCWRCDLEKDITYM